MLRNLLESEIPEEMIAEQFDAQTKKTNSGKKNEYVAVLPSLCDTCKVYN
jgi:hypothetical protein